MSATAHSHIQLVVFRGESRRGDGTMLGTLYVLGAKGERYPMAGGPPPGQGHADRGGHSAGQTPAGHYVLDQAEHHVTRNWPGSVIPWGAPLRETNGQVEYFAGGHWIAATGPHGSVVEAARRFLARDHRTASPAELNQAVRSNTAPPGSRWPPPSSPEAIFGPPSPRWSPGPIWRAWLAPMYCWAAPGWRRETWRARSRPQSWKPPPTI